MFPAIPLNSIFLFSKNIQTDFGAHTAFYITAKAALSPAIMRPGPEPDKIFLFTVEDKTE
jgi:hypothetical protein